MELTPIDPKNDVVLRCKNGTRVRNTSCIYVVFRIDCECVEPDAEVIAYSYDEDFGTAFIEQVASREVFGQFWDYKNGSPCFDPIDDDGNVKPLPTDSRFMMWDSPSDDRPPTLSVFEKEKLVSRYKLATAYLTINDLMSIETDGDRFFKQ